MLKMCFFTATVLLSAGCIQIQTRVPFEEQVSSRSLAASPEQNENLENELKLLENKLKGNQEIEQYSKALPYFRDIREKMHFLKLDSFKKRQKWLNDQNFWSRIGQLDAKFASVIKSQDIAVGMSAEQLKRSWGEPNQVYVSGIPQFGNGKWVYIKQAPTPDGYRPQKRIVYLESGLVTGWETQ
jgi:hypothetical protein